MPDAQTICRSFTLEGIGLHTGTATRVTVAPSAGRGRVFLRDGVEIPALAEYVTETRRCTTLGRDDARVRTVEHLLAALWLHGVDEAAITVEGPELPALDGSAWQWSSAITAAGICPSGAEIPCISIAEPGWIDEGDSAFFLCPAPHLSLYAVLTMPETVAIGMTAGGAVAEAAVREQILRARTFGLEAEVEALLASGLARGASLDNAVVLTRDGYLNPTVWPREPAWHKVLDLAGDLALIGARLTGQIVALRAGHRGHVALARQLRAQVLAERV